MHELLSVKNTPERLNVYNADDDDIRSKTTSGFRLQSTEYRVQSHVVLNVPLLSVVG